MTWGIFLTALSVHTENCVKVQKHHGVWLSFRRGHFTLPLVCTIVALHNPLNTFYDKCIYNLFQERQDVLSITVLWMVSGNKSRILQKGHQWPKWFEVWRCRAPRLILHLYIWMPSKNQRCLVGGVTDHCRESDIHLDPFLLASNMNTALSCTPCHNVNAKRNWTFSTWHVLVLR